MWGKIQNKPSPSRGPSTRKRDAELKHLGFQQMSRSISFKTSEKRMLHGKENLNKHLP